MRTDTDNLIDAGRNQAAPVYTDGEERDGIPFLVGDGGAVTSLESYCRAPVRARGRYDADSVGDAVKYLGRLQGADTVVFWRPHLIPIFRGHGVAIVNFHSKEGAPGFCDHTIHFRCMEQELQQFKCPVMRGSFQTPKIK